MAQDLKLQDLKLITLVTNPVPIEVTMPTRDEKIVKREIIERYVVMITNGPTVVRMTNDVLKFIEPRRYLRTEIWMEVPMPVTPASSYPPPPIPFSKGSVRQSP